jgi:hypothetical protein
MRLWQSVRRRRDRDALPRRGVVYRSVRMQQHWSVSLLPLVLGTAPIASAVIASHGDGRACVEPGLRRRLVARVYATRALALCSVVALANACGGRILAISALNDSSPESSVADAGGADGASLDSPLDEDVRAVGVSVASADAQSSSSATSFSTACNSFALSVGKTNCEPCVNQADRKCNGEWSQLREQCQVGYGCGSECICTAPGSSSDVCACIAGCLPLQDNPCTRLWTAVMSCIGSVCAGHC